MPDEPTDKPETSALPESRRRRRKRRAKRAEDAMSPEAIAKRVAALGGDDEGERLARDEEIKLAERRAKAGRRARGRRAGSKPPPRSASRRSAAKVPPKRVAYAADANACSRAPGRSAAGSATNQKTSSPARARSRSSPLAGAGATSGGRSAPRAAASTDITQAVDDEDGRIGDPAKDDDEDPQVKDPRPVFKTEAERRDAALAKYRDVEAKYKGTGAAYLARLEEGSLLLDKPDLDGAIAAFDGREPVAARGRRRGSEGARARGARLRVRGEGRRQRPREKDKWLDQAAQEFRALENTDVKGFKELGMYHQARVAEAKGDKDKAIAAPEEPPRAPDAARRADTHPFVYLETVAEDRLRQLNPTALPPKAKGGRRPGGPGGSKMSEEQIQKLIEQLKQQQGGARPAAGRRGRK